MKVDCQPCDQGTRRGRDEEGKGRIRNAISTFLLRQTSIQYPFPCRALREIVEYIPKAADPNIPVAKCGELICLH